MSNHKMSFKIYVPILILSVFFASIASAIDDDERKLLEAQFMRITDGIKQADGGGNINIDDIEIIPVTKGYVK